MMGYKIEIVSEEGWPDYEVWTCQDCGRVVILAGVGGDVCCCPCEFKREGD